MRVFHADMTAKVCLLVKSLAPSGVGKSYATFANLFAEHGCEVHLIIREGKMSFPVSDKVQLHFLEQRRFHLQRREIRRLVKTLEATKRFDLTITPAERYLDVLPDATLFVTVHLMWSDHFAHRVFWKKWKVRSQLRACYRGRRVVAVSQSIAEDLKAIGIKPATLDIIPDGYDFKSMRIVASEAFSGDNLQPYILHVGALNPNKRHDLLLDAMSRLQRQDVHMVLIGEGVTKQAIQDQAERLGLSSRVHLMGWQGNPYQWMKHAALTVICSDSEGLSRVLVESLAVGTPVISTDAGGNRELMTGPLADYLIPTNDVCALAKVLERVLNNPYAVTPEMVERFDGDRTVDWYLSQANLKGKKAL